MSARNFWVCTYCTFENVVASPLCGVCNSTRGTIWKCETPHCGKINKNTSQCGDCLRWNSDLSMEKSKWMRNPDDSWNCMKCTYLNRARDQVCHVCKSGPNEMLLDELKNPIHFHPSDVNTVDKTVYVVEGKSTSRVSKNRSGLCYAIRCENAILPGEVFCSTCRYQTTKCACGALTYETSCYNCIRKKNILPPIARELCSSPGCKNYVQEMGEFYCQSCITPPKIGNCSNPFCHEKININSEIHCSTCKSS